ncbi:MAG: AsnC family transcriptional regulator [Actinomycetota bacterium]
MAEPEDRPAFDETDGALLAELQSRVPLTTRPYADLGARLGLDEGDVLERVRRLREDRVIRQVSAIFDTAALGYGSTLVATAVAPERLEAAAEVVSGHPGVSHNYERDHRFNLWWTLAVPPGQDLRAHVGALHRLAGASSTRVLPSLRRYKLGVRLQTDAQTGGRPTRQAAPADTASAPTGRDAAKPPAGPPRGGDGARPLSDEEVAAVVALQEDLPCEPTPFATLATRHGVREAALLATGEALRTEGVMRRFAAVLHHRRAGFGANAMSVWEVPADEVDAYGERLAAVEAVSHCYRRPTYPDWPYALFGMLHATSEEALLAAVESFRRDSGLERYDLLRSVREFKKVRVRYFDPSHAAWAEAHLAEGDAERPLDEASSV